MRLVESVTLLATFEEIVWQTSSVGQVVPPEVRPVHLLRVSLLRVLESNFPGDSL